MLQGIRPAFRFNVVIMSIYLIKRGENMFKKTINNINVAISPGAVTFSVNLAGFYDTASPVNTVIYY